MINENYQGWSNRETWATKLWIDNDEGLYNLFRDEARKSDSNELANFARQLFEEIEATILEGQSNREARSMMQDIGSLWRVDWREIADSIREDNDITDDNDDEETDGLGD